MNIIISKNEKNPEVIVDFDCFPVMREKGQHLFAILLRKYPKKFFVKKNGEADFASIYENLNKKIFNMGLIKEIMKDKVVMATFDDNTDKIIQELFNSEIYVLDKNDSICITRNTGVGAVHELDIKENVDKKTGKTEFSVLDKGISKVMEKHSDYMYGYELEKENI